MGQHSRSAEQGLDGQSGPSVEFEGLFEHVSDQVPDWSLQVDIALTARRAVSAFKTGLAIPASRHDAVIPSSEHRVNY